MEINKRWKELMKEQDLSRSFDHSNPNLLKACNIVKKDLKEFLSRVEDIEINRPSEFVEFVCNLKGKEKIIAIAGLVETIEHLRKTGSKSNRKGKYQPYKPSYLE